MQPELVRLCRMSAKFHEKATPFAVNVLTTLIMIYCELVAKYCCAQCPSRLLPRGFLQAARHAHKLLTNFVMIRYSWQT